MQHRSSKRFRPLVIALLLLGVTVSAARTQDPPKKPDTPKETKPMETTYEVNFSGQPWPVVFKWLTDITKKPMISPHLPTGTVQIQTPKGAKYTLGQIIDILNEALTLEKHILIQRANSFTLIPADKEISSTEVETVKSEQLKDRGSSEVVNVVVELRRLVAEDVQVSLNRLKGDFGSVVAIPQSNSLLLTDQVKNLRTLIDTIAAFEERDESAETFTHKCKYIRPSSAEQKLKELLGDPAKMLEAVMRMQRSSRDSRGSGGAQMPTIRMHYITSDDERNLVLVTGPANIIGKARELMTSLDKPQNDGDKPRTEGPITFQTYSVPIGSSEAMVASLQSKYQNSPSVKVTALGTSSILVMAYPDDQFEIARLVKGTSQSKVELVPTGSLEATKVAETLNAMFSTATTGENTGPSGVLYIEAQEDSNAVVVRGSEEQIAQVKQAVSTLNGSGGLSGTPSTTRIITLEKGSASTLAEALQMILPQMRNNPVRVISPNSPQPQPRERQRPMVPPSGEGRPQSRRNDIKGTYYVAKKMPSELPPMPARAKKDLPGAKEQPITLSALGSRLILMSTDPKALSLAQEVAGLIVRSPATDGDFQVIPLKHAKANEAARVLDEAFNGPQYQLNSSQHRASMFAYLDRFRDKTAQPPRDPRPQRIRVVADMQSNSLLVKANTLDMLTIMKLLDKAIDAGPANSKIAKKTWYLGPLKHTTASSVAKVMKDLYRFYTKTNPETRNVSGFAGFNLREGFVKGLAEHSKSVSLWVGVDERSNSLALYCSEPMYQQVKSLVDQMEMGAKSSKNIVKIIPLRGLDSKVVTQAIKTIQGKMDQEVKVPTSPPSPPRPDFFERKVKEDRKVSQFFDPRRLPTLPNRNSSMRRGGEEGQQQPPSNTGTVQVPRGEVIAQPIPELGSVIIRTNNPEDAKLIAEVIELLIQQAKDAEVTIELVELKYADVTSVANTLSQLFARVNVGAGGNNATLENPTQTTATTTPFGASSVSIQQPPSVGLIPIPRFNSLIIATAASRVDYVKTQIAMLDKPTSKARQAKAFQLKKAAASRVALLLSGFYEQRYPPETSGQNQIRFTYDDSSNTVFVQAAPADMEDIARLIEHIDNKVSLAKNDLVIVPLRNALALDLANTLIQAVNKGVVFPTVPQVGGAGAGGLQGAGGGLAGGQAGLQGGGIGGGAGLQGGGIGGGAGLQGGGALGGTAGAQVLPGVTTKTTSLRFIPFDKNGRPLPPVESGMLEDIQITPDVRINALILSAPEKSMNLILKLIDALDVPPTARAEINIFPLKNSDAATVATLLQQLFLGTGATGQATQQPGLPGAGGLQGGAGQIIPLQLTLGGTTPEGAPLIDLRLTADLRTNSVIAAGSINDLEVIEAIISRLESSDQPERKFHVYELRNSTAADVAAAVNDFLQQSLGVLETAQLVTAFRRLQQQVVVVPEPFTNKLLISATPRYFSQILSMIQELDQEAPQVVIQALVAEVRLNGNQEFGVEFGLQNPLFFQRGLDITTNAINNLVTGNVVQQGAGAVGTTNILSQTGFNFNRTDLALPNSQIISPGTVGFQQLTNLNVGRVSSTSGFGGFVFSAQSDAVNVLVRALKAQGRIDILSRPQIMTLDNQAARILIGQDFPYLSSIVLNNVAAQQAVNYRPVGVQLQVIPKITPDDRVIMRVIPEISSVDDVREVVAPGQLAPVFNVQTVETTVSVLNGETVVLGGLIQQVQSKVENKIPWLGDLPGVGWLFRYRTQQQAKQELIVILTPHIVRNRFEADVILAQESRRMDWILKDVIKTHGTTGLEPILPAPREERGGPVPPPVYQHGSEMPIQPGHPLPHGKVHPSAPVTPLPPPTMQPQRKATPMPGQRSVPSVPKQQGSNMSRRQPMLPRNPGMVSQQRGRPTQGNRQEFPWYGGQRRTVNVPQPPGPSYGNAEASQSPTQQSIAPTRKEVQQWRYPVRQQ